MGQNCWIVLGLIIIIFYLEHLLLWDDGYSLTLSAPRRKFVYYLASFTWGLPLTLAGICIAAIERLRGRVITRFEHAIWIHRPGNAGFSLGCFLFAPDDCSDCILAHEYGHSIQNVWYGPFALICVAIPSVLRYWYRVICPARIATRYNDIWFESQATNTGNKNHPE